MGDTVEEENTKMLEGGKEEVASQKPKGAVNILPDTHPHQREQLWAQQSSAHNVQRELHAVGAGVYL